MRELKPGMLVKHFKGNFYNIITTAIPLVIANLLAFFNISESCKAVAFKKSIDKDTSNNIGTIILNESIINLIIFITDKTSASSQMLSILIPSQLL